MSTSLKSAVGLHRTLYNSVQKMPTAPSRTMPKGNGGSGSVVNSSKESVAMKQKGGSK